MYQRNPPPAPSEGGEAAAWSCGSCGLHAHPRWFASRVVAGSVAYTMAQPSCAPDDEDLPLHLPPHLPLAVQSD